MRSIVYTLTQRGSIRFWLVVVLTGLGTGLCAAALIRLLYLVQHTVWPGKGDDMLAAAASAPGWWHVVVLLGAGLLTGAGQLLLARLPGGSGIDILAAIWFHAGRLPVLRTLGSAVLSTVVVGMGATLGREGAPKQAGAVVAHMLAEQARFSDDTRRLLVACGGGAGLAAAYGVPLGGALFALEVLRGELALRFVLPALVTSLIATDVSWIFLLDAPTYLIPTYPGSISSAAWALVAGPIIGITSVIYVRGVAWADHHRPKGHWRIVAPILALTLLGIVSIKFPQLLGNGRDVAEQAFTGRIAPLLLLELAVLKPAAILLLLGSGTPGGLFTPSLAFGALLGGVLGHLWSYIWPGLPPGVFALLGAGAMLASTTQGPISSVVLMMELTGQARASIVPLLLVVATATLVARTIEPRSVYDARLSDAELRKRLNQRDAS